MLLRKWENSRKMSLITTFNTKDMKEPSLQKLLEEHSTEKKQNLKFPWMDKKKLMFSRKK